MLFTLLWLLSSVIDVLSVPELVLPLQFFFLSLGAVEQGLSLHCGYISQYHLLQVPLYPNSQTSHVYCNTP